uniref:Uncharacterized protein n=1 Tax=Eutreptiella gymnastica TaxID=73025 RepID=A0A6U7ZYF6_9EUGL|mmetsp:Transcript_151327/g.264379  ORF Transcript_151327/g.264379 Transcript_151327/m.264379 type:complete len:141 (+) Transcript_151327:446-868(+)
MTYLSTLQKQTPTPQVQYLHSTLDTGGAINVEPLSVPWHYSPGLANSGHQLLDDRCVILSLSHGTFRNQSVPQGAYWLQSKGRFTLDVAANVMGECGGSEAQLPLSQKSGYMGEGLYCMFEKLSERASWSHTGRGGVMWL